MRVDCTTICGTDLHILKGDVPEVTEGRVLGHEAVGTVEAVGSAVTNVAPGDRVLVSCISACGRCRYCREGRYGQCLGGGGWILGHLIDGTQAEYVRVPFADTSTYMVPEGVSDEEILMLADILPTAYEVGVLNGHVQPGDTVAVVGAGPIGLSAMLGAQLYSPSHIVAIDLADARLEAAKRFGADLVVNNGRDDPSHSSENSRTAWALTWPSRRSAFRPASNCAPNSFVRVVTWRTSGSTASPSLSTLKRCGRVTSPSRPGLVDTYSTPTLLRLVASHQIDAGQFGTHHFRLDDMIEAYDVFERAADTGAVKVVLSR